MASRMKKTWAVTDSIGARALASDMSVKFGKGWLVRQRNPRPRDELDSEEFELCVYVADMAGFAPDMTGKTLLAEYIDGELTYSEPPRGGPSGYGGFPGSLFHG